MSVSPQSLARTRDKRSHKVPARFNDTVYALKDATEVLRTSTRSRPGSLVAKRDHEDDVGEEKEEVLKPSFKKQNKAGSQNETTSTPTPPRPLVEHIDPNSPTTPPPSTTPSPTGPPPPATVQPKTTATPKQQPINSSNSSSKKESSSSALSSKKKTNKGFSLIVKQQSAKKNDTINPATTPRQATPAEISGGDSNFNIHQHSNIAPNVVPNFPHNPAPVATPARARAPAPMPAKNQQGNRYFTNLTPNQPWSRIIKNEPIVLPLSVGNIGPITATLQQIARHALDPIFRSRKATLCLAYQDERKLNYITSNFAALIKITKYLGVKDRLNLRCVNRTWKSVIDCETVWKEVTLNSNDTNLNWKVLTNKYLDRYRTTDIIFNGYGLGDGVHFDSLYELGLSLPSRLPDLKRMFIKSVNSEQNSVAYNLLGGLPNSQALNDSTKDRVLRCVWEIKVGVDPLGIATVDLNRSAVKDPTLNLVPTECNHDGCIELYDLKEKYEKHHSVKINIKPI